MKSKWAGLTALGMLGLALAGCGTQSINASQWMIVHPATKTVDLKIESTYSSAKQANVFDGFTQGHLLITIPVDYHVTMNFVNNGPIPESIGIYDHHHLAFPGAGEPYAQVVTSPTAGLLPGQSQSYTFTASKVGTFILGDMLNGDPDNTPTSDLWDIVKVVPSGVPSFQS
ncbi:Sulfocyanin (SoxE) domain-containing protein [Sulfobacillus thermosulfidooxidans DSM 9293]|uniref:Sulfocyanin (SoxE) domain-containing protein n=1 Tax=Sulfobacillus thermosulfidooxidans (strain DSM 9293 / VKM B-1269 / AT-1) TaxID=929705 RepID=A0A1W1W7H0_SULTA|nr:sulfocyanin-like copper-binding protein [Sulfobacillus thermosulfidooxidans]SMC02234.1 Sulfocyanin (SoxE) domain-containing protein [Sulfobacillus thermosulfidooxidans DSM 9293]